jgi:hypothetical protein
MPERAAWENGCHLKNRRDTAGREMPLMLPKPVARTADTDTARTANGTTKMLWPKRQKHTATSQPTECFSSA